MILIAIEFEKKFLVEQSILSPGDFMKNSLNLD
jgi:hypothetical protein